MLKIISGFQTGADIAAIDFAIEQRLQYAGWVPKGRKSEAGRVPDRYTCQEHASSAYPPRTKQNVQDADFTIIFHYGPLEAESGCALTLKYCDQLKKPHMVSDLLRVPDHEVAMFLRPILKSGEYKVVNVAGSRESKAKGIYNRVRNVLRLAWVS